MPMPRSTFARSGFGDNPPGRPPSAEVKNRATRAVIASRRFQQQSWRQGGLKERGQRSITTGAEVAALRGASNAGRRLQGEDQPVRGTTGFRPPPLQEPDQA